jgi:hypothetical protein
MSERWKYQIKTGGFWGIFMSVFGLLFEMKEHPIAQQIAQPKFWFRAVVYLALGIFVLGYVNWKQKEKQGRT